MKTKKNQKTVIIFDPKELSSLSLKFAAFFLFNMDYNVKCCKNHHEIENELVKPGANVFAMLVGDDFFFEWEAPLRKESLKKMINLTILGHDLVLEGESLDGPPFMLIDHACLGLGLKGHNFKESKKKLSPKISKFMEPNAQLGDDFEEKLIKCLQAVNHYPTIRIYATYEEVHKFHEESPKLIHDSLEFWRHKWNKFLRAMKKNE